MGLGGRSRHIPNPVPGSSNALCSQTWREKEHSSQSSCPGRQQGDSKTPAAKPLCLHPALHFSPFLIRIIVMNTGKILQNRAGCCCQGTVAANIYFSTIIVGAVGLSFRDGADEGAAHAVPVPG